MGADTGPNRLILAAMLDGASLEQGVDLANAVENSLRGGPRVVVAFQRGGKWIGSPFDWTPTMRTLRAVYYLSAWFTATRIQIGSA